MRGTYSDIFIRDTLSWVDRSPPSSSPVLAPEKGKDIPPPVQQDQSVKVYSDAIKQYASETGLGLQSEELKKAFFDGLLLNNKKNVIRFGIDKPLDELVEFLVKMTSPDAYGIHPWGLEQDNGSVEDFYKVREYAKLSGWDNENCKFQFIRGLSLANQLEVRLCGLELPLDVLVDRLVKLEALEH